ncbi:hypothetical protein N786_14670 [Bacillus amyloliquefaciens UASWS BA1]|nr:hypothetical protein U722_12140 [Bacillus amyloliquefaciens LFB112]ERK82348.1 hypothetical protein N786_14670 [Bacillus amyloliquefaciens UASWS BA1]
MKEKPRSRALPGFFIWNLYKYKYLYTGVQLSLIGKTMTIINRERKIYFSKIVLHHN